MYKTEKYFKQFPYFFSNRKLRDIESANDFINPSKELLNDPFLLNSMDVAVDIILSNPKKSPIFIHGDCDADGVSACAVLHNYLKKIGFKVHYYIPNRSFEGHAISRKAIDYAASIGTKLMITCDLGMSSVEEISYAKSKKINTIITDHHKTNDKIPEAKAIINPWLDENSKIDFREYSGSAVAFKLCHAINLKLSLEFKYLYELMDIASIGIISDKVSITNENRYISYYGFNRILDGKNPALSLLSKKLFPYLDRFDINKIIRVINMATKLEDSSLAVKLLSTNNPIQINRYTNSIVKSFKKNQSKFNKAIYKSIKEASSQNYKDKNCIFILADSDSAYNGSIANTLSNKHCIPVMAISKMNDSIYKGSCRSLNDINILSFIESQKDILITLGGHPMAAGFTINENNINKMEASFFDFMKNKKIDTPDHSTRIIDGTLRLKDVNKDMISFFENFMPYGTKNNIPTFSTNNVELVGKPIIIGRNKESIRFKVKQEDVIFEAIGIRLINEFEKLITKNKLNIEYTILNQGNDIKLNILGVN